MWTRFHFYIYRRRINAWRWMVFSRVRKRFFLRRLLSHTFHMLLKPPKMAWGLRFMPTIWQNVVCKQRSWWRLWSTVATPQEVSFVLSLDQGGLEQVVIFQIGCWQNNKCVAEFH